MTNDGQLSLFGDEQADTASPAVARPSSALAQAYAEATTIAGRLPALLAFGTSSWSFPGWEGLVYSSARTQAALSRDGLREYASHPLLRTVGIDRSYYAPIPEADLRRYASQLPAGFRACAKAPASVMSAVVPGSTRAGGSVVNPYFLDADRLKAELLEPFARAFQAHSGPFVLECPPMPRDLRWEPAEILERLYRCLSALPRDFQYAVELRERRLLIDEYRAVLDATGAGHVYNYWSAMPSLREQAAVLSPDRLPFIVVRLLLRPGTWYEDQRERFRPFNRLVEPDPGMRDDVVSLIRASGRARRPAYVLVNNKAEGSAPLTIRALAARVAGVTLDGPSDAE